MKRTRVNLREIVRPQGVLDAERKRVLVECLRCHAQAVVHAPAEGDAFQPQGTPADQWRRLHQWSHHAGDGLEHYSTTPIARGAA